MTEKVFAIVVTFNRKVLLRECIKALQTQSYPLSQIVIVNNASTDGTQEMLEEFPTLKILNLPSNIGSSGGYYEGMKWAFESGAEWFWLMDDDVEPLQDALENQLKYSHISQCIHPTKYFLNGDVFEWEQIFCPVLGITVKLKEASFKNGKEWCYVNTGCFEGMLINRSIVKKIGYPDKRFFTCYDDTIYGFLASLYTNTIYIRKASFLKKINPKSQSPSDIKLYYSVRNYLLEAEYLIKMGFQTRGFYLLCFCYLVFHMLMRSIVREYSIKRFYIVLKAAKDGIRKNFGIIR